MKFEVGQSVICEIDVYRSGDIREYDGHITYLLEDGSVDVCYLEGYKSRNDVIKIEDIVAIVDNTCRCAYYDTGTYSGYLIPNPEYRGNKNG